MASIAAIYRYPVKGLSAEGLTEALLTPGETLPGDRLWAIENGPGRFDEAAPRHLPKTNFLTLMRDERLATFEARFDESSATLSISRGGKALCRGKLSAKPGRAIIEQFLAAYLEKSLRGPPRLVHAPSHTFSDTEEKCLHVINMASVRELERDMGRPVHPLRFRPNLVVDGLPPWIEQGWKGCAVTVGRAELRVFEDTVRCAATNVDPLTGRRDMDIPAVLARRFGHTEFGVYARVTRGGRIAPGASFKVRWEEPA